MASQEAIKELGTNGGGFFNANSAHPFEGPSAWVEMLEAFSLLLIPVASVIAFGRLVGNWKEGRSLLATMGIVLVVGTARDLRRGDLRQPDPDRARRRRRGRQSRRQGAALRSGPDGAVQRRHDRHQHGLGRRHARQLHARSAGWCRCSTC